MKDSQEKSAPIRHDWPSQEKYGEIKYLIFHNNVPEFLKFYNETEQFDTLSQTEKELAAKLLGHFFIGVKSAYSKFGDKYNDAQIHYATANEDFDLFAYVPEQDIYAVNLPTLIRIVKDPERYIKTHGQVGGIEGFENLEDMFEVAGVEEAAHRTFFKEKGKDPTKSIKLGKKYDYYLSIEEYRALFWKESYIKRFHPQYLESIKSTIDGARILRQRVKNELSLDDLPNKKSENTWPTEDQHSYNKQDLYKDNHDKLMELFSQDEAFSDLDDEMKEIGTRLYTSFFIGLQTISRRLGDKSTQFHVTFDKNKESDYGAFGVNESGEFVINILEFKDLINQIKEGDEYTQALGTTKEIKLEDIVELAGVELGSFGVFYRSGRPERPMEEMALRAMFCKKAYATRYMSQYGNLFEINDLKDAESVGFQ